MAHKQVKDFFCSVGDECPETIQIVGNSVICPGEDGLFRCTLMNSRTADWSINGEVIGFALTDNVGSVKTKPGIAAHLVERSVGETDNIGNRTSVVFYTPSASTTGLISILCSGGRIDSCGVRSLIVGMCGMQAKKINFWLIQYRIHVTCR